MAHQSEPRFLVLHGLRLKGFAEAAPVADGAGLDPGEAEEHLRALAGEMAGFAITLTAGITLLFAGFLLATSPPQAPAAVVSLPSAAGAAAPSRRGPVAARPRT